MIVTATSADILVARINARLTQRQAGELIYATERTWQDWETGRRRMPYAAYELFLLKTGQLSVSDAVHAPHQ